MPFQREFELRKEIVLKALASAEKDKSRKGGVDAPIADLINCINSHPCFFTTSSCSGRVSIFLEQPHAPLLSDPYHEAESNGKAGAKSKVKLGGSWVYVSHEPAKVDEVVTTVRRLYQGAKQEQDLGLLVFRFEPFIMALECSSLAAAQGLVACAMASGYRESGVTSVGKRLIVAVRSSIRLEAPIGEKGKLLVPEEYLRFLTETANKKFILNQQRIDRFMSTFVGHIDGKITDSVFTTAGSTKALDHKPPGHRRRKGVSLLVRDKLLSSLQMRQSKIILRINSLETDSSLVLSVLKSLEFTDDPDPAPKTLSTVTSGRFQYLCPEA
jgi:tRNA wybutosine-synthesizing protein 3